MSVAPDVTPERGGRIVVTDDRVARVRLDFADGMRFTASFPELPGVPPLTIDEEPPLGGGAGPNPAAVLASAVGGCLAASLLFCLRKARIAPERLSADVAAHIVRNDAGRFRVGRIDVELVLDVDDPARLARCREIFEHFCIVTESVRSGIPVGVRLSSRSSGRVTAG